MRDPYAGDISDYLKYGLLRTLAADDRRLGVAWYYNPGDDGRNDGRHREYLDEDGWSCLDAPLWHALKNLPERSVAAVERLSIWPNGTLFHRNPVPPASRLEWTTNMVAQLNGCSLVFADPDNGFGFDESERRHATPDDIRMLMGAGRAMVLIKFPQRIQYDTQEELYHDQLRSRVGVTDVLTLRTTVMVRSASGHRVPRCRWFTLLDHDEILKERLVSFARKLNSIGGATAITRPI